MNNIAHCFEGKGISWQLSIGQLE